MRLKTFCQCFSLQTGTIVIGSMSLVWSILSAISAFPLMNELRDAKRDLLLQFVMKSIVIGIFVYILATGAMAGLMIYGAQNKKPNYVFPWFALSTTNILIESSITLGGIVTVPMMFSIKWFFVLLAISSVYLSTQFYIWIVVYSFYKEIHVEKYRLTIPLTDVENCPDEDWSLRPSKCHIMITAPPS